MSTPRDQLVDFDRLARLLGKPPGWMLYWGNLMIALLLAGALALAALIEYPDEVLADVRLTTEPPPFRQLMPRDAEVATVLAPAAGQVTKGDPILVLASTAHWTDVKRLLVFLDSLKRRPSPLELMGVVGDETLEVGSLRPTYARLLNHLTELQYWLRRTKQGARAANLQRQLQQNERVGEQLESQLRTASQEYALAQANALRFDSLLQRGSASQIELDQARAQSLRARLRLEQQEERQLENELRRDQLLFENLSLGEQLSDELTTQWLGVKRELRNLQYECYAWWDSHVLEAQASGSLSWLTELQAGQQLAAHTPLWGIVPHTVTPHWIALGQVEDRALGKIGVGDTALLRLPAYPYREFGQLPAVVADISLLPQTDTKVPQYRLKLSLPQGLQTTYQRELEVRQSLSGQARIISEKRSLLARIFDRLWLVKERLETG